MLQANKRSIRQDAGLLHSKNREEKTLSLRKAISAVALCAAMGGVGAASAETLISYTIVDDFSIPKSLTGTAGDAVKGREVAINRRLGNCLACHVMPIPEQPFHGETGPDLAGVGDRYTEGELRLRIVDSKAINPYTMMPAFYRVEGFHRVMEQFAGKPILTAQEVEDVVAYLMTLKEE